jgi:hypothetical protein
MGERDRGEKWPKQRMHIRINELKKIDAGEKKKKL